MLVLHANEEQIHTFDKLIQTMGSQVAWEGRFIVVDDQLILEGTVRSLCFQFDAKEVVTDLIDFPINEDQVLEVSEHPRFEELINMALYAFGKWGMLKGIRVDQNSSQLNQLFGKILGTYYIEPAFHKDNFRFYKSGIRITYEEVFETVLESEKRLEEDPAAESQGLWHKLVWKKRQRSFEKEPTTLSERTEDRIGNNFYHVGYKCPKCSQNLYMAVYPEGKEVRIETEELGVYLARVYTCDSCCCFYTPQPERLLSEGLIYEMAFGDDTKAYEDYLELLGESAERSANFKYNEYEALRNRRLEREKRESKEGESDSGHRRGNPDFLRDSKDALRQMEEFSRQAASLPDEVFQNFVDRIEEGFYPDSAVAKHEKKVLAQVRKRGIKSGKKIDSADYGYANGNQGQKNVAGIEAASGDTSERDKTAHGYGNAASGRRGRAGDGLSNSTSGMSEENGRQSMALDEHGMPAEGKHYGMALDEYGVPTEGKHHGMALDEYGVPADGSSDMALDEYGVPIEDRQEGGTAFKRNQSTSRQLNSDIAVNPSAGNERSPGSAITIGESSGNGYEPGSDAASAGQPGNGHQLDSGAASKRIERYRQRIYVVDRLSERQRSELRRDIQNDKYLTESDKKELFIPIDEYEFQRKVEAIEKKFESSGHRNYANLRKVMRDVAEEELPEETKQAVLRKLDALSRKRGAQEVQQLISGVQNIDRAGYKELERKLKRYEDVDLSPFENILGQLRDEAEKKEINHLVKHSRKKSRKDLVTLMRRLEDNGFADENTAPYMEKIKEKVREMDEISLDELLGNIHSMNFDSAAEAYEKIEQGNFLPELKINAIELLSKRLQKIRTDECELLVRKLQEEMDGTIKSNPRHHFYPARKVMLKTAQPEEVREIDTALKAYAGSRDLFEYPIFTVDTARDHSGREGMMLTPENLYYSTRLNAYEIPVSSIDSITASTGLLNRKLTLEQTNGAKHKLPFAVGTGELLDWAEILEEFVRYLQEKPASRKLEYLAKDQHDTICCYRCGHVYRNRDICPECGYKNNK